MGKSKYKDAREGFVILRLLKFSYIWHLLAWNLQKILKFFLKCWKMHGRYLLCKLVCLVNVDSMALQHKESISRWKRNSAVFLAQSSWGNSARVPERQCWAEGSPNNIFVQNLSELRGSQCSHLPALIQDPYLTPEDHIAKLHGLLQNLCIGEKSDVKLPR